MASFARRIDGPNKVIVIEPPAPMQSSSIYMVTKEESVGSLTDPVPAGDFGLCDALPLSVPVSGLSAPITSKVV